jgi:hypothetical protein
MTLIFIFRFGGNVLKSGFAISGETKDCTRNKILAHTPKILRLSVRTQMTAMGRTNTRICNAAHFGFVRSAVVMPNIAAKIIIPFKNHIRLLLRAGSNQSRGGKT